MSGDIPIQAGRYDIDELSWFDVRLCDAGLMLSFCDQEMNSRHTVIVSKGQVVDTEFKTLFPDE